jgi:tetratricopeptide (TPR) repeat protein
MFTHTYGHYIPLTWLSFALDYTLWGMNPLGYRAVNSLLHGLNAILFFLILHSLIRSARPGLSDRRLLWGAAAGACFFALHPLRAASVAWITERRDVLSGCFFLLTILTYLRWTALPAGSARLRWISVSLLAFACMILSKALGMTIPLVFLVLDVWPLRRFPRLGYRPLLAEKIPYFALMIGAVVLTSMTQKAADTIYTSDQYPLRESLAQPGFRVSFYVAKTVLPLSLSPLYFYRPGIGLPQLFGWIAILGVTAFLIARRQALPAALVAWLSYGLLIAPVSGLVQAGPHFAQDSWTYVPCLPFAALFAALVVLPGRPRLLGGCALATGLLLAVLSILSVRQGLIWKNSLALWDAAIRIDPDVYYSWYNRGRANAEKGHVEQAIEDFTRAIDLRSGFPDPWHERGIAWMRKNRPDLALRDLDVALRLNPDRAETAYQFALAEERLGNAVGALHHLSRAIELRPTYLAALAERARIRSLAGDFDGAIADCSEAIRIKPDFADAYLRRGLARINRRDVAGAIQDFARSLEVAPAEWPQRNQAREFLERARKP